MRTFNIYASYGVPRGRLDYDYTTREWTPVTEPPRTREQAIGEALDVARRQGALADQMVWEEADGGVQGHCPWPEATA